MCSGLPVFFFVMSTTSLAPSSPNHTCCHYNRHHWLSSPLQLPTLYGEPKKIPSLTPFLHLHFLVSMNTFSLDWSNFFLLKLRPSILFFQILRISTGFFEFWPEYQDFLMSCSTKLVAFLCVWNFSIFFFVIRFVLGLGWTESLTVAAPYSNEVSSCLDLKFLFYLCFCFFIYKFNIWIYLKRKLLNTPGAP